METNTALSNGALVERAMTPTHAAPPPAVRRMGADGRTEVVGTQPVVTLKLVKLAKSYTWEVKADCAASIEEAFALITKGDDMFRARYGDEGTKEAANV